MLHRLWVDFIVFSSSLCGSGFGQFRKVAIQLLNDVLNNNDEISHTFLAPTLFIITFLTFCSLLIFPHDILEHGWVWYHFAQVKSRSYIWLVIPRSKWNYCSNRPLRGRRAACLFLKMREILISFVFFVPDTLWHLSAVTFVLKRLNNALRSSVWVQTRPNI